MPSFISDRRIYLNRDRSAVVDESDPEASFLLAAPGQQVSAEDAKTFGLSRKASADSEPAAADTTTDPNVMSESKAVKGPAETKSIDGPAK